VPVLKRFILIPKKNEREEEQPVYAHTDGYQRGGGYPDWNLLCQPLLWQQAEHHQFRKQQTE
jgi:hypothetical protein